MIKILCVHCKKHIYNIMREPLCNYMLHAVNFIPATKEIKQPQQGDLLICPYCGIYFIKDKYFSAFF